MQMNEYPEREILSRIEKAGARVIGRIPRSEGGVEGAVFLVKKR